MNRPDNPLRSFAPFAGHGADDSRDDRNEKPKAVPPGAAPETFEDELETPAFLRRRKNLFE